GAGKLAVAFALGGAAGAVAHARLAGQVSDVAVAQVPALIAPQTERVEIVAPGTASPAVVDPRTTKETKDERAPARDDDLSVERTTLDRARRAFGAGDYGKALASIDEHASKFPHGRLEEEREALAVRTLAGAGRNGEAKARGARFAVRFPQSFLLPTVNDVLRGIP
ncbi:MAG TPA: hypothetical protein VJT73_10760, partial [Polyangiaceae bacterium]|nr:hypothetical protein [Polyangiaceae bacterium]